MVNLIHIRRLLLVLYNLVNESLVLTYSDLTVRITSVNKIWSLSNKWYLLFFLLNVFPNLYKTY